MKAPRSKSRTDIQVLRDLFAEATIVISKNAGDVEFSTEAEILILKLRDDIGMDENFS